MSKNQDKDNKSTSVFIDPKVIEYSKNPRTKNNLGFTVENMTRLRNGIQRDGLNHSLLIRKMGDKFFLVAGERRIRSILRLVEDDETSLKNGEARVLCKNQRTGKMEPASEVYKTVECKITDCSDDREARRQAIQENTLHHELSEYELLMQVDEMERDGFTRQEQADTLGVSEAHISQSHSLLDCHPKIIEYIECGKLTRTAAITFIPIPKDKVEQVLDRAIKITYAEAEQKEQILVAEKKEAMQTIQNAQDVLTIAQYTGNGKQAQKARRTMARASKVVRRVDGKLDTAKSKSSKKMTVDTIMQAAKDVEGADEKISRPQSMKNLRAYYNDICELLIREGPLVRPDTKKEYDREQVTILRDLLGFVISASKIKHPLDVLTPVK